MGSLITWQYILLSIFALICVSTIFFVFAYFWPRHAALLNAVFLGIIAWTLPTDSPSICSHGVMKEKWLRMSSHAHLRGGHFPSSIQRYFQQTLFFVSTMICSNSFTNAHNSTFFMDFDATLGFPGEGPSELWSLTTANIDSFAAHPTVLTWPSDVILMQETSIGDANKSSVVIQAKMAGWHLHHGRPVPKLRMKNNVSRINHGVAVMGKTGFLRPFEPPATWYL